MLVNIGASVTGLVNAMNGGLVVLVNGNLGAGLGGGGCANPNVAPASTVGSLSSASNLIPGLGAVLAVEPVQATIWHCLNNYAFSDACFLAERVHAESPSDETLHTLSTAYYRAGSRSRTYVLLQSASLKSPHHMTPKNRYLFALVSYELEKHAEAEATLLKQTKFDGKNSSSLFDQMERIYGDLSPFALKLFALICVQTERSALALEAFGRCLKLNPFLWNAYEYLCRLGNTRAAKAEPDFVKKTQQQQRVFQLPADNSSNSSSTTPHSHTVPPSTYIPMLVGSTAAALILSQCASSSPVKTQHGLQNNNPLAASHQNNQNYYKDTSLNASNVSVFSSGGTGVLHPSNRNNIKAGKRNLFTSTPMSQHTAAPPTTTDRSGVGGGGTGANLSGNNFGIIPLHLMDSSSTVSAVNSSSSMITASAPHHHLHHHQMMAPCTGSSPCGYTTSPIIGGGVVVHNSPVIGDYSDELVSHNHSIINPQQQQQQNNSTNNSSNNVEAPRAKKPCLRTPWQQQVTSSSATATAPPPPTPQQQQQQQQSSSTISASNHHPLRRSSRLHVHLKENNKQSSQQIMQTPPSGNNNNMNNATPDSNSSPGANTRRSSKGKQNSSVLKPKLRLNNGRNNNNAGGGSSSSTSTVTDDHHSPVVKCEGLSLESSAGEFYRMVAEKSIEDVSEVGRSAGIVSQDRAAFCVDAFRNGVDPLLHILSNLSIPYTSQLAYNCDTAIAQYQRLKPSQYETGWVYGNIARCYFELGKYEDSVKHYREMMDNEPWRTEGLEWLSTAYWHLQKEVELSALAQDLMKANRTNEVATWVAAGNCFSLHKEHETAIKFFKRAIQVNRYCAYAYTLLGHEYVTTEELEKAMRCFRSATRIDASHYNAWYGMGMIFYKQERYERAEVYYNKALSIHPNNSVLLCHLGVVQHALGKPDKSLKTFDRALDANQQDPLCKFHRASVLFGTGKLDEALSELEHLKEIVPKESLVYFLIAKIFSKKGETHKALLHFSWATDLDPKGANNQIKESIEPVLSRVTNPGTSQLLTTVNASTLDNNAANHHHHHHNNATNQQGQHEEDDDDDDEEDEEDDDEDDDDDDDDEDEGEDNNNATPTTEPERVVTRNMRNNSNNNNNNSTRNN